MLWVVAGLIGLVTVAPELDEVIAPAATSESPSGFAIGRAPDGQFYTQAQVRTPGGEIAASLRLMVDPGAQQVLLSAADAERLGFEVKPGFTRVTLPSLAVGALELRQVEAVIAPNLPVSLLGRSYLSRLAAAEVRGDSMLLR